MAEDLVYYQEELSLGHLPRFWLKWTPKFGQAQPKVLTDGKKERKVLVRVDP